MATTVLYSYTRSLHVFHYNMCKKKRPKRNRHYNWEPWLLTPFPNYWTSPNLCTPPLISPRPLTPIGTIMYKTCWKKKLSVRCPSSRPLSLTLVFQNMLCLWCINVTHNLLFFFFVPFKDQCLNYTFPNSFAQFF